MMKSDPFIWNVTFEVITFSYVIEPLSQISIDFKMNLQISDAPLFALITMQTGYM